jgi:hypothetical protein
MTEGSWHTLASLAAWRVTEVPRESPPGADGSRSADGRGAGGGADLGIARRVQALAAAYGTGGPVAFGWVRERATGPVRVIAAGHGLAGQAGAARAGAGPDLAGEATLTIPAGARGVPLASGALAGGLGQPLPDDQDDGAWRGDGAQPAERARRGDWAAGVMAIAGDRPATGGQAGGGAAAAFAALPFWTPLPLIADGLLAEDDADRLSRSAPVLPPSMEDGLLSAWDGAFGWLVLAEPVDGAGLAAMVGDVARAQLMAQRHDSPRSQLTAKRAGSRRAWR